MKKLSPAQQADFQTFWRLYPRRRGKAPARRAWLNATRTVDPDTIFTALKAQIITGAFKDPDYTPYPATWLNQERWDDDLPNGTPASPHLIPLAQHWRTACRNGSEAAKRKVLTTARDHGISPHDVYETARSLQEEP